VEKSGLNPEEIFFTDDDPKNVQVAKSMGINSEVYNNLQELKNQLSKLGVDI
jgi:FMN phosphatase YigB (HAD superfamily)